MRIRSSVCEDEFRFDLKVLHVSLSAPQLQLWPPVFSVSIVVRMLACRALRSRRETKRSTSGKIACFSYKSPPPPPQNPVDVFPFNTAVISFNVILVFPSLSGFLFCPYTTVCSIPIPDMLHTLSKRESCLSAICHLLSSIQQLSVGCSIFLIVANFLVQFYATFTWMFMTLSAATKI